MDISQDHKARKKEGYWSNLVEGETGVYKAEAIDELIGTFFPATCGAILDIGCGTSVIALSLRQRLEAARMVFMDYDAAVLDGMRKQVSDPTVEWRVGDIFNVGSWTDRFDLVLLLDMMHEVYSFYGRPVREMKTEIDHMRGVAAVRTAMAQVSQLVNPGGGVIITDNVLAPERAPLKVRLRNDQVAQATARFFEEYPSRRIAVEWLDSRTFRLDAHDFCILLTQYNKIKAGQEDRWNVEKFEIHQYMTHDEFASMFDEMGFTFHAIVGTPQGAWAEWSGDFEVLEGASRIPEKRISLLALKKV